MKLYICLGVKVLHLPYVELAHMYELKSRGQMIRIVCLV